MTSYIKHDVRVEDGGVIYLPPWVGGEVETGKIARPDLDDMYGTVLDAIQQYPLGTKFELGDRVFRYVKFGDDDAGQVWGAGTGRIPECGILMSATALEVSTTIVSGALASKTVVITEASVEENDFAGGYFCVQDTFLMAHIESNTATVGGNVTLTLQTKLPVVLSASYTAAITKCIWKDVVRHSGAAANCGSAVLGVYQGYAPSASEGLYGWIQTWGPAIVQVSETHQGDAHAERALWADNGAVQCEASYTTQQPVGWYLQEYDASTLSLPVVFLILSH